MPAALSVSLPALVAALLVGAFALTAPAAAQTPAPTQAGAPAQRAADVIIREDGLVAEYFAPASGTEASAGAIIVLGGSEGGLRGGRNLARNLSDAGFAAIAVSYFGEPGQQTLLNEVPIEPVGRALAWLKARPELSGPIAVLGVSKGGELALLTASRNPEIRAVVAGVPSNMVWAGIDQSGGPVGSSWTEGGQPLAYVPYDLSRGFNGVFNLYNDSLKSAPAEAEIPVERINGPILMISGQADGLWPSSEMASRVEQRLRAHNFSHPVENIAYPDAGHAAFGIPVAADTPGLERAVYMGGTVPGLVAARADGWPRVLRFLRASLNGG